MSTTFNKKALANVLAENLNYTKKAATDIVDLLLDEVKDQLIAGNKVDLAGFGRFEVKVRSERTGYNPQTKENIVIPASKALTFRVAKALKEDINK